MVDFTVDFCEDWSGGTCANHHGPKDCYVDAFHRCANEMLAPPAFWSYLHCSYASQQPVRCLDYVTPPAGAPPNCTLNAALERCASMAGTAFDPLLSCALSPKTAAAMEASGKRTSAATGGSESWVWVEGRNFTDKSRGLSAWAHEVRAAICTAATARQLPLPAACA